MKRPSCVSTAFGEEQEDVPLKEEEVRKVKETAGSERVVGDCKGRLSLMVALEGVVG
jgi:hypothetical protein